ncbi:AraC family transcriptional regulator [Sandaracinus amylolyticus]|uniref:Putative transcriptional regulator n=1 Tax=Sandaracinus amylolyticus TaxID=927083 RepID=A0A0F6YJ06_9BACT|nr:helix-turn-helix transcriptional regulator [Sandaracinus amylolyticus]AKF06778.1 putative transcriptional regulator [Sandaracinus amylolyticus]
MTSSPALALPLSRFSRFETCELDEASSVYSRMTAPVRIHKVSSREAFGWRAHQLALGPLTLSTHETQGRSLADCPETDTYLLSFALSAASVEATTGDGVVPIVRGRTGLLAHPRQCSRVSVESGSQIVQLNMPHHAVRDAMTTLTGVASGEVRFRPRVELDAAEVTPLRALLSHVLREADEEHPSFEGAGMGERLAEALLFKLLLTQPHSHARLFVRTEAAEPAHVRRAAEFLEANADRQVTMAHLTQLTGVGARSLQAGFRKHRGCSPLEFVRARRLERARVRLLTDDVASSVTDVAHDAGFTHLGRFSVSYKARFGESPMQTRARRWVPVG